MNHYFQNNSQLKSNQKTITYDYRGHKLFLEVDNGVFSKDRVDFGTNVLLNSLPEFKDNISIIDVGCGYGIIGLAIARAYPNCNVTMVDVNDRAISLALKNALKNNIHNATILSSNLYEKLTSKFNVIISNPPIRAGKNIVHKIVEDGNNMLDDDGEIYVVIQKKQGANSLKDKMKSVFGNIEVINKDNGYYILKSVKKGKA